MREYDKCYFCQNYKEEYECFFNIVHSDCYLVYGLKRTGCAGCPFAKGFEDELEIIKNQTGKMPLLLLDDVFSELDPKRRKRLLKFCEKTQTLITCTDLSENDEFNKKIHINNAQIV